MKLNFRLLNSQDYDAFEKFLKEYMTTSMFMRSNVRRAGLEFKPKQDYSADYWGAFENDKLTGILALNWNGNIFTQVPDENILSKLFHVVQQSSSSNFAVKGILGPDHQARQILAWLNPSSDKLVLSETEVVYSLTLKDMILPPKLKQGAWVCRLATQQDLAVLVPWRVAYEVEACGAEPNKPRAVESAEQEIKKRISLKEIFVLEDHGLCVAEADYNATLPDIYQIGGVWTPPEFRDRGYARGAVAGALLAAEKQGVQTGILFTKNPAAMRAYESLGFQEIDQYHITLFNQPLPLN